MGKPEHPLSLECTAGSGRLIKSLGLALALHAPVILYGGIEEVWQAREGIARAAREEAKSILHEHRQEKSEYIGKLKGALERGESIDLGDFYLKTEYLEGRADKMRMEQSVDILGTIERKLRADMKDKATSQKLQEIKNQQGHYDWTHSYLSSALIEGEGNCHAREKFTAALIHRLYPEMKMAYQVMKIDGEMHTRTLVEIEGKWHSMEKPYLPLSEADLEGTVLYDKYDYVRHYVGSQGLGNYKTGTSNQPPRSYTRLTVTDDYLCLPLPDGISSDQIKNITSKPLEQRGSLGQGFIGTPVTKRKDPQIEQDSTSAAGCVDCLLNSIDVEVYTPDVIEQNRRNSETGLRQLKAFSSPDDEEVKLTILEVMPRISDACAEAYIPIVRIGAQEVQKYCKIDELTGTYPCSIRVGCTDCTNFFSFKRRLKMYLNSNLNDVCFGLADADAKEDYDDDFGLFGDFGAMIDVYENRQ